MNFKKVICVIATFTMAATMFTACGSSDTAEVAEEPAVVEEEPAEPESETEEVETEAVEETEEAVVIDESVYENMNVYDYIGVDDYSQEYMDLNNDGIPEMVVSYNDGYEDSTRIFTTNGESFWIAGYGGLNVTNIENTPYYYYFFSYSGGKQICLATLDGDPTVSEDSFEVVVVNITGGDNGEYAYARENLSEDAVDCDRETAEAKIAEYVGEEEKDAIIAAFEAL